MEFPSVRSLRRPISGGLLALALVAGAAGLAAQPDNPELGRVQETVRGAISDAMDAGTFKKSGWTSGRLDAATVAEMHATLNRRLGEHMTGAALAAWQRALHESIDRDSDGEHVIVLAGGADEIEFETVEVDGESATATGRAHVWVAWVINKTDVDGPRSARPAQWDSFSATLAQIDGTWYVDTLGLNPEAGG